MKVSLYLLSLGIELCLGRCLTENCSIKKNNACTKKGGTCKECKPNLFTYCASQKSCDPKNKECKCSVNCKLNDEECKEKDGTCTNYKECKKLKRWFVCDKKLCGEEVFPKKFCACKYYKKQKLCPQDSKCTAMEEGECMTNTHCKQYANQFPGYSCNKKLCKSVKCSCKYKEQSKTEKPTKVPTTSPTPICKDKGCKDQNDGECMIKKLCKKY